MNRFPERKPLPLWSILAVPLVCICLLFLLEVAGARARTFLPVRSSGSIDITVLRTNAELYRYWKQKGVTGRIALHAGRYLHYVAPDKEPLGFRATRVYPVSLRATRQEMEGRIDHTNVLRAAVQSNMVRELYMVMPPELFRSRFSSDADYPDRGKGIVRADDVDAFRTIVSAAPELKERVLLSIDATYLSGSDGNALLERLFAGAITADVITFSLAEDNPDVREDERLEALRLLESFAAASQGRVRLVRHSEGVS